MHWNFTVKSSRVNRLCWFCVIYFTHLNMCIRSDPNRNVKQNGCVNLYVICVCKKSRQKSNANFQLKINFISLLLSLSPMLLSVTDSSITRFSWMPFLTNISTMSCHLTMACNYIYILFKWCTNFFSDVIVCDMCMRSRRWKSVKRLHAVIQ